MTVTISPGETPPGRKLAPFKTPAEVNVGVAVGPGPAASEMEKAAVATPIEDDRAGDPVGLASTMKLTVPGPVTLAVDDRCTQVASLAGWLGCHTQLDVVCTWKLKLPPAFVKLLLEGTRV